MSGADTVILVIEGLVLLGVVSVWIAFTYFILWFFLLI